MTDLIKIEELFKVQYGTNLELNRLTLKSDGINFVSRTSKNNGVSARVQLVDKKTPIPAGTITVAGGGSVLETFLQDQPYYSGRDLYYLTALKELSDLEKLFYCLCIRENKYRYNYGRQANKTLGEILIPHPDYIPSWVKSSKIVQPNSKPTKSKKVELNKITWKPFRFDQLFLIERGTGPRKNELTDEGTTPFITSIDNNNGLTGLTNMEPTHNGNTITVNRNGSVGEAFYQPVPFCSTEDVHVFNPKFKLNSRRALFLTTLIKRESYRFNYSRKWGIERMNKSVIKLPVNNEGLPDWEYMEDFIRSLPYSRSI